MLDKSDLLFMYQNLLCLYNMSEYKLDVLRKLRKVQLGKAFNAFD